MIVAKLCLHQIAKKGDIKMRIFKINENIEIVCDYASGVRDGFTHIAKLMLNGQEVDSARVHYINRTWESYEFQSVMRKLIEKTTAVTKEEKEMINKWLQGDRTDWSNFKAVSMVAKLGDIFCENQKDKNDWKERMLKAGLENKGLIMPDD